MRILLSDQGFLAIVLVSESHFMFKELSFLYKANGDSLSDSADPSRLQNVERRGELSLLADPCVFLVVLAHGDVGQGLSLAVGKLGEVLRLVDEGFVLVVGL